MRSTLSKRILLTSSMIFCALLSWAQKDAKQWAIQNYQHYSQEAQSVHDSQKEKSIQSLRKNFQKKGYRTSKYGKQWINWKESLSQLSAEGIFVDMEESMKRCEAGENKTQKVKRSYISNRYTDVWYRLGQMAEAVRKHKASSDEIYTEAYLKALIHYGNIEISRNNYISRFHESCFAIPTSAMNIYYVFLDRMEECEKNSKSATALEKEACQMLKTVALQAWTQPIRKDETDNDVSNINRFRKHVWWVGGNGLAYRSLLPIACMYRSIPMIDVLAEVAQKGISCTSQRTYDTSFWTEGFTADGAGWGHGKQCLIWGYPIDGTSAALNLLTSLQGTTWQQKLTQENKNALFNYLRGSNWYYYKGYTLPCLGRHSFDYAAETDIIKSSLLIKTLLKDWRDSFNADELAELLQFEKEMKQNNLKMASYQPGLYNGTRYFFNNDDLIKKNADYHIMINMASVRCDGIESAPDMADAYNFTTCDGLTLFQRTGREYMNILGAFDVLQAPGITARLGMDQLKPVTNWRGYCSKHNYAGGATNSEENAVAGYIFEKMNASDKKDVNDTIGRSYNNKILYGIQAYKSYFIFGDYFLALGAGITNLKPEMKGDIQTSIEQTSIENELFIYQNGKKELLGQNKGDLQTGKNGLKWLVQKGKFAYTVLPQWSKNSFFSVEERKSDWAKMNVTNKKIQVPASANILQIGVSHGQTPKNDTYGYVVYCGSDMPAQKLPFEVLRNDSLIQAARSNDKNTIEAVFYNAKERLKIDNNNYLTVSAPCVLLLEKKKEGWSLAITDPQMDPELKEITIGFANKQHTVKMPQGIQSGKPAHLSFK